MNQEPERIALLGAGVLGQTVCAHLRETPGKIPCAFFDDTRPGDTVDGVPVLGGLGDVVPRWKEGCFEKVLITVGYKHLAFRARLFVSLRQQGVPFARQIHPSCVYSRSTTIEEGAILFPGCTLDVGSHVRANTLLNTGCTLAHDSAVGPHSFLGPGVTFAGFIDVGEQCFLGVGTVLIDNIRLGAHTQTGGGTVVIDSYQGGGLLVGVPAREVRKFPPGVQ